MIFLAPLVAVAAKATVATSIKWFTAGAILATTVKDKKKDKKNALELLKERK